MKSPVQEPEELRFIQARVFDNQQHEPQPVNSVFIEGEKYSVRCV